MFGAGLEHISGPFPLYKAGKSLWRVWTIPAERLKCGFWGWARRASGVNAEGAKLRAAAAAELIAGDPLQLLESVAELLAEEPRCRVRIRVRPSLGLGHDGVDDAQLQAMRCVGLERLRGLARLRRVAPEDRSAALRRDHGVDRVLLHQHPVGGGDRNRAAR